MFGMRRPFPKNNLEDDWTNLSVTFKTNKSVFVSPLSGRGGSRIEASYRTHGCRMEDESSGHVIGRQAV